MPTLANSVGLRLVLSRQSTTRSAWITTVAMILLTMLLVANPFGLKIGKQR